MTRACCLVPIAVALFFSASAHADARLDVQHALERVVAAGGFHARVSGRVFGAALPPTSGEIDVVFPDKIHARTDVVDFIARPDGVWVNAFGVWAPVDRDAIPVTAFAPAEMRRAIASIRDVHPAGSVMTAECQQNVYRFRATGQLPGAVANGDARIWICERDGRPAKIEASSAANGAVTVVFDWSRRPEVESPER
ncbi:MAG TPA: hypothetical protein VJ724_04135 [Tahibacter sp.]|nr:hypothetical protein [Tahibacter sp.]